MVSNCSLYLSTTLYRALPEGSTSQTAFFPHLGSVSCFIGFLEYTTLTKRCQLPLEPLPSFCQIFLGLWQFLL